MRSVLFTLSLLAASALALGGPGEMCGGIAAIRCREDLTCQPDSNAQGADRSGTCVEKQATPPPKPVRRTCGGIAGLACPPDYRCVYPKLPKPIMDAAGHCEKIVSATKFCGGIAAIQCPEGFTCEYEKDQVVDAGGKCVPEAVKRTDKPILRIQIVQENEICGARRQCAEKLECRPQADGLNRCAPIAVPITNKPVLRIQIVQENEICGARRQCAEKLECRAQADGSSICVKQ